MATHATDVKGDPTFEHHRTEDVAEKISHSSGEIEAQRVELDEAESARVLRKVDMRLVPMLSLLYLVAFIDRSNSMSSFPLSQNASLILSSRQCKDRRHDEGPEHASQHPPIQHRRDDFLHPIYASRST
jgi:hypothetical protein